MKITIIKHFSKIIFVIVISIIFFNCTKENIPTPPISVPEPIVIHQKRFDSVQINNIAITAWQNYHKKRFEQAALDFERLYKKKYRHYDTLFGAGVSFMKYYDLKKALKFFSITIKQYPHHFEARYFRALLLIEIKNYNRARKDLEKIVAIKKTKPFICGLYSQDLAGNIALKKRKQEALNLLKSL